MIQSPAKQSLADKQAKFAHLVSDDPVWVALLDAMARLSSNWRPLYAKSERGEAGRAL